MKCNTQKIRTYTVLSIAVAVIVSCQADTYTDEELRHDVLRFLTTRCCGRVEARRILTKEVHFGGDTNKLARILAECAQTNDERVVESALDQLEKYGTSEQLPFLYSCATNPLVGDMAVKAVLRIEGVTSNSVALAGDYFAIMDPPPPGATQTRDDVCIKLVDAAWDASVPVATREYALSAAYAFASNINQCHQWLDAAFMRHDDSYQYSRRRLSVFRAALLRGVNQYSRSYVTNAINELVAYPEANLPD